MSILNLFKTVGRNDWDKIAKDLTAAEMERLSRECDGESEYAAEVSAYLELRGGMGRGDHGHDEALEHARKEGRKVRKARGYNG